MSAVSASSEVSKTPANVLNMPSEYGEVIFRINIKSPKQLYIVGINHKDPESGRNNSTTVQTQMEIFRIGEWLKQNMSLNLLLPEGFFSERKAVVGPKPSAFQALDCYNPVHLDNFHLQNRLSGETSLNAEMLLMEYHGFRASQVEDEGMYNAVRDSLCKFNGTGIQPSGNKTELRYLQEIRTAQILQNIPEAIENEFNSELLKTVCLLPSA